MSRRFRLAILLLEPSLLSGTVCVALALSLLAVMVWPFIINSALPQEYFFGEYGLAAGLHNTPANFALFWRELMGHALLRNMFSFLVIFTIGSVVYTAVQSSNKVMDGALGEWVAVHDARAPLRSQIRAQVLHRFWFRFVTLISWGAYSTICVNLFVPFAVASARYGVAIIRQPAGWYNLLFGGIILVAALHLHVIFMRAMALRPRLFDNDRTVLEKVRS